MEERKNIFDYLGQIFMLFGFMSAVLNLFCLLFGESAKEFSTMFSLGKNGINVSTMAEFFLLSPIIVFLRFFFFTDVFIKKMSVAARTAWMVLLVLSVVAAFIIGFDWFPADMWLPWLMFFACFFICFIISTLLAAMKEKIENKKMEEALRRLKEEKE